MLKKSTVRIIITAFVVMLFASIGAMAASGDKKVKAKKPKASQTSCSKTPNADIVRAIKEQFAADAVIKDQMPHINISVKRRTVTLEGWLDGKDPVAKAAALAKSTKCVRRVINKLGTSGGSSCSPRQKVCGNVCIDKNSECTIDGQ